MPLGEFTALLPVVSLVVSLCIAVGGVIAYRGAVSRSTSEIQKNTIEALQAQNETQEKQITACEKEIRRLKEIMATVQYALKRRGLRIEVDGDSITLYDEQTRSALTAQIRMRDDDQVITEKKEN